MPVKADGHLLGSEKDGKGYGGVSPTHPGWWEDRLEHVRNLEDLNRQFAEWGETYNQAEHSEIKCTPLCKWLTSTNARPVRLLSERLGQEDLFFR